jgi:hypothetical protein
MAQHLFGSYYLNPPVGGSPPLPAPASGLRGLGLSEPVYWGDVPSSSYFRWADPQSGSWAYEQPPLDTGVFIDTTTPLDPVALAVKVNAGQTLTEREQAVWDAQSATAKTLWLNMARATAIPAGSPATAQQAAGTPGVTAGLAAWLAGSTALLGTSVRNSYLLAGVGVAAFALLLGKKRR